jgi:23S rRNA (adenine2030-N6)-methyltransferase
MNYRHAYHAGNFADCFKHALLVALLDALARKPAPFFVLETHAGAGRYDLDSEQAQRTNEADQGIRRLLSARPQALERYLTLVDRLGLYPGSPALTAAVMRQADRLACCELLPQDHATLRRHFRADARVAVHLRSGWEALTALLPPAQKRGLVFIDPPFEDRAEFAALAQGLATARARFPQATAAAWYPIKHRAAVTEFHAVMRAAAIPDITAIELHLRDVTGPERMNGCGLLVINPPYQWAQEAAALSDAVLGALGGNEPGAGTVTLRIADE